MKLSALIVSLALFLALPAQSADRSFSVNEWAANFAAALNSGGTKKAQALLYMKKLERQAIPRCADCDNKKKMEQARILFEKGQYSRAIALYNEIPKGTDYWFQAVEERGWAYFRLGQIEKALAQSKTLISPQFANVVSAEAFFLQSLSELSMCDYKSVFETHVLFKEKQRERLAQMQELAKSGMSPAVETLLVKADTFPLQAKDVAETMKSLPILFYKDKELQKQLLHFKVSQKASEILLGTSHRGLQKDMTRLNTRSLTQIKKRLSQLAQQETNSNFKTVQKLNLVEVEAIQRVHTDLAMDVNLFNKTDFKKVSEDQLVFMDDGHPWIDELDKYEVATKSCAQNIRRKM